MVTGLLCVLPILLPTQAQAYETLATTHPVGRRRLSRSLWDAVHARDGPRPADDAPNEECHPRVPEDHVRRGDKRCADEPEHVGQRGACDGISNRPATSSAAAVRSFPVHSHRCPERDHQGDAESTMPGGNSCYMTRSRPVMTPCSFPRGIRKMASTPGNRFNRRRRKSAIATFQTTRDTAVPIAAPVNPNMPTSTALAPALTIAQHTSSTAALRSCPVMVMTYNWEPALAAITWLMRRTRSAGTPAS